MDALALIARALDPNGIDPDNIDTKTKDPLVIAMSRRYCKIDMCPIEWATIKYRPSIPGNVIYLLCFLALLGAQIFYGSRKKTWTYMSVIAMGLLGESIGYIGRIMLNLNPFIMNNFLLNLIPLTIAPALITAGIYLCLGRVITAIGSENSRLKPKMYSYVFVSSDVLALILQAIGGAMAATSKDNQGSKLGTRVMIAGMISQVISMAAFFAVWCDFVLRTRRAKASGSLARTQPSLYAELRASKKFQLFQWSLLVAAGLIFVRCIYRIAELWEGFNGHLANEEATFMVFEGPMIILAVAAMTVFHPGRVFDDLWVPAGQGIRDSEKMAAILLSDVNQTQYDATTAYQPV
ncbi:RTA1 like protein-domain-containing protein [Massariosphaeria phaeospora]|uniref:RTA1 like protein-domain-containing protein n=1 Tax=Massariosphaeria phaeospora TaxID=100035 RepID=A0A7C8IAH1_9PLEO|nr:RTA1 like protein-domain-containing protein [Massariosphaeria phaeospora]